MVAILAVAMTMTTTTLSAFAQADPQRNNFGQGASNLAQNQAGAMGDHSREGGFAGTAPYDGTDAFDPAKGRTGIGNIDHPADVADALCPPGSPNPACQ